MARNPKTLNSYPKTLSPADRLQGHIILQSSWNAVWHWCIRESLIYGTIHVLLCGFLSVKPLTVLMTRDFFIFSALKAGSALQRPGGLHGEDPPQPWAPPDPDAFRRWCRGKTGLPFVDAAMRELACNGFINNRGRQNAANLFAKARLGPAIF